MNPTQAMVHSETAGVQPVMVYIDHAVRPKPIVRRIRVSTLPIIRPTTNMQAMVPSPRGPITRPAVTIG